MTAEPGAVHKRRVFYIGGFDPANPRKYWRMFAAESAKQAALSGARIAVGPAKQRGPLVWGWRVKAEWSGHAVEIDYQCLKWNDIVRRHWPKDGPGFFLAIWRAVFTFWRQGALALRSRTARANMLAPVIVMTTFLFVYTIAVAGLCALGAAAAAAVGLDWRIGATVPLLVWIAVGPAWRRVEELIPVGWLGRGTLFMSHAERGLHSEIEARQEAFARIIADAAGEPGWDEILIVGHSMGCQLALRVIGQAVRLDPDFGRKTPVALLTLGQLVPLYSMMTDDPAYRGDIEAAVKAGYITWIDYTARPDAGSFGDVHPLTGLGVEIPPDRPILRSPRFHVILTPETYRRLRWSPLDLHFQYLMATETPGGYDYFEIVTGPRRLSQTAGIDPLPSAGGTDNAASARIPPPSDQSEGNMSAALEDG